jgi:hypothetical protein
MIFKLIKAFYLGVTEFKSCVVTSYESDSVELNIYDFSREFMHIVTLRKFEP